MSAKKPLVLLILDGWGYRKSNTNNAIATAKTPHWDHWIKTSPHMLLDASGHQVGLPDKQMGNSEVGHMHIGAGRVIYQDFTRINQAIESGDFFKNNTFLELINETKKQGKTLHLMGLLSPGGVHSHENHLFNFLKLCEQQEFRQVVLHLFLDGRDTPPQSALASIDLLQEYLTKYPVGVIASLAGRYYAMDRDKRWERIEPVYNLLTEGISEYQFDEPHKAIQAFYADKISDEFIPPIRIGNRRPIVDGDSVFFFNFRSDRARQLTQALLDKDFTGFTRKFKPRITNFVSMTVYSKNLPTKAAYPSPLLSNTLGEIVAKSGLHQLRIAETEKYAHITFFLNGGIEKTFENEDRILIPSPKVATYNLQPEMSAPAVTDAILKAIENNHYDLIICNYANADMVGHTGDFQATVKAVECLDHCMYRIAQALENKQGSLLITADHGNAEIMFDNATCQAHTAHTSEPVPLLYIGPDGWRFKNENGSLIDIAPTVLTLLGIKIPAEMTGESLLTKGSA
jgi:2,3-bisphosphoglycerate-independent phosphoglycerate mutase